MTPDRWNHVKRVFGDALALPTNARHAFIERECNGDGEMRKEVMGLFAAHRAGETATQAPGSTSTSTANGVLTPSPAGELIGQYRLLRPIGEGGMGIVYEAEQRRPRRTVALKLIRNAFSSPQMRRRFELEAEVLGRLEHPNIARIYEAGIHSGTGGAQPFIAMELVAGLPVTEYAASKKLSIRDRMLVFGRLCDAVEYAHQRGIIHRDLKPANILVNAAGIPKVVDFGIARNLGEAGAGLTLSGEILGSPRYMAPEQSDGDSAVTQATDVYGLGAVLYELLTQKPPFDGAGVAEVLRLVREKEVARPRSIDPSIDLDLETICLKCLEKNPQKRYANARSLGNDVVRWIKGEPINARHVSGAERLSRWCRRRPAAAGLAAALMLLVVTIAVGATLEAIRFSRAADRERGLRKDAGDAMLLAVE